MNRYHLETLLPFAPEAVFGWHLRPGAFERLTPPWADVKVLERRGGISDGGEVLLRVSRGPVSVNWRVRHTAFEQNRLFRDEQVDGPFAHWSHGHYFEGVDGHTRYSDEVEWDLPAGPLLKFVGGVAAARRELDRMFRFRHRRLQDDLSMAERYPGPPLRVAITGASGLLGTSLQNFLTTAGHEVIPVVRSQAKPGEVHWSPQRDYVDLDGLEGIDVLVHLAGESIAGGRWNAERKRAILESREGGTRTMARAVSMLRRPPKVVIGASAIGVYGDRGDEVLTEDAREGRGFLAEVTKRWEAAWAPLRGRSARVVLLRLGMLLSPAGGALGTMILPFKMGAGGRLGSGRQYVSWIDLDDAVGLIYHVMHRPTLRGVLNATAPQPVTNATFTTILGQVLRRPTLLPVPKTAVRAIFGEMGEELLLHGQRVMPARAQESGYRFLRPALEDSFRFQLGEMEGASPSQ
ncbi:MAG: TIGR01777 family oxidoreductase [Gemmatimonadota bacterium]